MNKFPAKGWSRRDFLASAAASGAGLFTPPVLASPDSGHREFTLSPAQTLLRLVPEPHPRTEVWSYNGLVPGPEIRIRQGERLRVRVQNSLTQSTTVHWHGIRVPNAMDGVPHLTQAPIEPGAYFDYEFDALDAGTFWYHPHQRSFEQVARGLYGPLIVEEKEPLRVDRDITWVLDDWRLTPSAEIHNSFGDRRDMTHNGRVGNTVTINGQILESFAVRAGERIRLRLINAANARIFGLQFDQHEPIIVAFDGQPVTPHAPGNGMVVVGPAMRVDLVIDMTQKPGAKSVVTDRYYRGREYRMLDFNYADAALRPAPPLWSLSMEPNPLAEPDLMSARRHKITFDGGMMGNMAMMDMRAGKAWFINGVAALGHQVKPMLTLALGQSCVLAMHNATAWHHPIHLHGHTFRVINRNQQPTRYREWQDTVLMAPDERVEIAFVADNPGDWMFHCHILEHQASGMMGVIRVSGKDPASNKTI
ncbi:MAG: multicopper oxidase family protein [Burkholderiaceae bacterium]